MQNKPLETEEEKFKKAVLLLQNKTQRFKEVEKKYKKIKDECTETIAEYFKANDIDKGVSFSVMSEESFNLSKVAVKKVQKITVEFDVEMLENNLDKDLLDSIILKDYSINNIEGFIAYLKSCNADPKKIKSFLSVIKTVNTKELDRLEEIGVINNKDIEGCYTTKKHTPYFLVTKKESGD